LGTGVAPPVRPSATPRRRRQLRTGRGCRGLLRFACSNAAASLDSCLSIHIPHRHSGAGRNPVTSVGGGRENLPLPLLDPGLRRDDGRRAFQFSAPGASSHATGRVPGDAMSQRSAYT
jgi:hypothetical protein